MCKKQDLLTLTKDWSQSLSDHSILCDLWSDVIEATGTPLNFLQKMDITGELAFAHPAQIAGSDRYLILFATKYFLKPVAIRQGIIGHELGHFYVYRKKLLEQLRVSRDSTAFFSQFVFPISIFYQQWTKAQKQWIKNFFDSYVLDILKVPGEIFTNLWVKENLGRIFVEVFKCQLEEYRMVLRGKEKIHKPLVKFPTFSLMLRLNGLLVLSQDVKELSEEKKVLEAFEQSLEETLIDSSGTNNFETFVSFEKSIMEASCSLETANSKLPQIFNNFLTKIPLKVEDFVS